MHMRLLEVEVEAEAINLLRRLYEEKVIDALSGVKGCRFAGLIQSITRSERCLSLTLWDTPENTTAYEGSALFAELMRESSVFFTNSVEYTIKLSEDLRVEYVPVARDPVVHSYPVAAQSGSGKDIRALTSALWVRMVSLKILPGKLEAFKQLYRDHSIPALRSAPGCLFVYLLESDENRDEVFSVTIWKNRQDAVTYERSGVFERLIEIQKETLCGHAQERLMTGGTGAPGSKGTADVSVEHFTILAGRSFP
jgi:heme-degrading monooxygenase HmoA